MNQVMWSCQPFDSGWLIQAAIGESAFAYHIKHDEFAHAHEPDWVFWSASRSLSRSVAKFREPKHCGLHFMTGMGNKRCGDELLAGLKFQCQNCIRREDGYERA